MPDTLIDEILARYPGTLARLPDGRIARSAGGGASRAKSVVRSGTGRPPLPPPPRRLPCRPSVARAGFDLRSARAVSGLLNQSGVSENQAGRYLLIDSGCGHLVHTMMAVRPSSRWLGLDRDARTVAWASQHIADGEFTVLPDEPPIDEADESFDGAVALELAHRLEADRLGAWLDELRRLVRPGGFLVLGALGYAALADLADRENAGADELRTALASLDVNGSATVLVQDRIIRLFGENRLAREIAGHRWQSFQPMVGAGPRLGDLYLGVRREDSGAWDAAAPLAPIGALIDGTVEAVTLAARPAGPDSTAVTGAVKIADAGTVRREASVFVDLDPVAAGDRQTIEAIMANRWCSWPDLHLLTLRGASVVGEGTVIVQQDNRRDVLLDSAREFLARGRVPRGLARHGDEGFTMPAAVDRRIADPCLLLKRPWANNFGHWMTDQATVLSWLVRIGQLPSRRLIVTRRAWTGLADVMRQTVEAILPDAELIEHPDGEVWQFDSLAYAMPLHVPPSFKLPAALDSLRAHLLAVATPTGKGPRRLHVLRGADASRRLDNEAELLEISAAHDFVPVQPERLSLAEQVSLFAGAEAVIGVKGAALTAILFAASSCPLIVLSPASFVDLGHWNIASLRGQPYWELYGPVTSRGGDPSYRNFRIDPAKFETLLQRALGKRPRRWWRWRS